jgi:hypothetical protein
MAQNFLPCDRDQQFLLPPSPRDWLPEDHLDAGYWNGPQIGALRQAGIDAVVAATAIGPRTPPVAGRRHFRFPCESSRPSPK